MITSYEKLGVSATSTKSIDRRYKTVYEKVYGKQSKPPQQKQECSCNRSYDCASDYKKTGWNRSEVPEYKSIAPRDYNLPQINTSLYVDSLTLW